MGFNLTDRSKWILATLLFTISTVLFVLGWTTPFIQEGWLSEVRTWFPFLCSILFILFFAISIYILNQTTPPTIEITPEAET